jgi:hypothetical protein
MVRAHRMPDERPLKEQLEDLITLATHRGMHEAANFIRSHAAAFAGLILKESKEPEVFGLKKGDRITVQLGKLKRTFKVRCVDVSADLVELLTGTTKSTWTLMRHGANPEVYVLSNMRNYHSIQGWTTKV